MLVNAPLIKYRSVIPCTGVELEGGEDGGAAIDVFFCNCILVFLLFCG